MRGPWSEDVCSGLSLPREYGAMVDTVRNLVCLLNEQVTLMRRRVLAWEPRLRRLREELGLSIPVTVLLHNC